MKSQDAFKRQILMLFPTLHAQFNSPSISLVNIFTRYGHYRVPDVIIASGGSGISGVSGREEMDLSSSIVCRAGPVAVRGRVIDSSYPGGRVRADGGTRTG